MPNGTPKDWKEPLSPRDIELWVRQEVADVEKASELRVKELKELARAYSAGDISPEQADALHSRYHERWREALPGAVTGPGISDERILELVDRAAAHEKARRLEKYRRSR
jgi:hypothetical protein